MMNFRTIFESCLDFLYPPSCVACERLLGGGDRHICSACWSQVVLAIDHPELADEALAKMGADVDAVVSAFVFQKTGPLQALLHALKYGSADQIGIWLGERMAGSVGTHLPPIDLITAVPLHRAKERERGYNQAAMVAKGFALRTGSSFVPELLRRTRHTPTQTKLSIEQRRVNVAGAFEIAEQHAGLIEGTTVLVVDDVITTGATIAACAQALRRAGAVRVIAGSVALADHEA
jgi:ComF family protein